MLPVRPLCTGTAGIPIAIAFHSKLPAPQPPTPFPSRLQPYRRPRQELQARGRLPGRRCSGDWMLEPEDWSGG
ncbi:hypothetical protein CHLRE_07g323800v5 [Chlamydomonas reinhardtii]|uniref:Uncharacterized protein n=1 Tax=Chlamydomonas reinhardtii TaxID=3055 RepID=A0A2K3DJ70_CHLRE|nr:uncharacterized protein CHLRE_07g323800v5 [Chlamydomonas reinhardtii]PNW80584.1 hypothetical protein CHLRE_07g323800v5 [Chlamydomonas reinhardtii]